MIKKLLLASVLWLPMQQPVAAIVDQHLELALTIGFIGANVPSPYSDLLSIGDVLTGNVTAQNVDDTLDGFQSSALVDFEMTVAGVSFDSAANVVIDQVEVENGVVVDINFLNTASRPNITFQTDSFWRIIFPEWSPSSPTNFFYEITGPYTTRLTPVPLPAAAPLFGSAIALFAILGWRRKTSGVDD